MSKQLVKKRLPDGTTARFVENRRTRSEGASPTSKLSPPKQGSLSRTAAASSKKTNPLKSSKSTQTPESPPPQKGIRRLWRGPLLRLNWSKSEDENGTQIIAETDIPIALAVYFSGLFRQWFPQIDASLEKSGPIVHTIDTRLLRCSTRESCERVLRWMIESCHQNKSIEPSISDFETAAQDLITVEYLQIEELQNQLREMLRGFARSCSIRQIGEVYKGVDSQSFACEVLLQEARDRYVAVVDPKEFRSYDSIRRYFRCNDDMTYRLMDLLDETFGLGDFSITDKPPASRFNTELFANDRDLSEQPRGRRRTNEKKPTQSPHSPAEGTKGKKRASFLIDDDFTYPEPSRRRSGGGPKLSTDRRGSLHSLSPTRETFQRPWRPAVTPQHEPPSQIFGTNRVFEHGPAQHHSPRYNQNRPYQGHNVMPESAYSSHQRANLSDISSDFGDAFPQRSYRRPADAAQSFQHFAPQHDPSVNQPTYPSRVYRPENYERIVPGGWPMDLENSGLYEYIDDPEAGPSRRP